MFLLLFDWGAFRHKKRFSRDLESGCGTYSYIGGAGHEMAMQGFEPTTDTLKVKGRVPDSCNK